MVLLGSPWYNNDSNASFLNCYTVPESLHTSSRLLFILKKRHLKLSGKRWHVEEANLPCVCMCVCFFLSVFPPAQNSDPFWFSWASLVALRLKRLPAMRETWVQSLGPIPGSDPWVGKIPWRRKWQPTLVLLPGESHGRRSLVGYSQWGRKELHTTERLHFQFHFLAL